ncbi:MAG: urease accessory protein UreE [Pseudomonadota bacterium]
MIRAAENLHSHDEAFDSVTLTYEARFRRRIVMTSDGGMEFLLDLPKVTDLKHGDCLVLEDGRLIKIVAADEPLLKITADDPQHLTRLVWHIGNRHLPCQIEADHILITPDPVIADMVRHLGGTIAEITQPFTPEGGAYGHGRTHSHEH